MYNVNYDLEPMRIAQSGCSISKYMCMYYLQECYGKILHGTDDLKTNACTTSCGAGAPKRVKKVIAECHEEVVSK